ncbi:hypothetical protein ACQP00_35865 [Dactylosporangium sp. CS-047395]|uniref:hypothetical protein n=1 Tax=Dactylosporangium sp. CS-047395 TaxID=3239936 RepID=UPI003D8E4997
MVGMPGSRRVGGQRAVPGPRFWFGTAMMTVLADLVLVLGLGIKLWYDHARLEANGATATAVIDDVHESHGWL